MNTDNSETNEPYKFVLNLSQRLDLRSSNKHITLQNLSIYYIRKQFKNNKLKAIVPTWNNEFELPDGFYFVLDIQGCFEFIIKKHEILTKIPPIHVYIDRINNGLVFKTKDGL